MVITRLQLFSSLERILARTGLTIDTLPTSLNQWNEFIERVNNSFYDFEQERYLLERSMIISSRELVELNERLETAQAIAHIGYWFYNVNTKKLIWSKETYRLFGIDPLSFVPSYEKVMNLFEPHDRKEFIKLITEAKLNGKGFEKEMRIIHSSNDIKCMYIKAQAHKQDVNEAYYNLSGIIMDITERKQSEDKLMQLNQKLIALSRQAGMSEIATVVLHNIGNILSSANVSITYIQELVNQSEVKTLAKIADMINNNLQSNPTYLLTDKKGKLIPEYLSCLAKNLISEYEKISGEMNNLINNVSHIKDIVVMQNSLSGISGIMETINIAEVCDLAIQMSSVNFEKLGIMIHKNYDYHDSIVSDKTKLLQILVNLITNAKDALSIRKESKKITITLKEYSKDDKFIKIIVHDNGIGITKGNLTKVFSMGFTTKKHGHGFGLHSSALTAKELGGTITVSSDGVDKGSSFNLILPKLLPQSTHT